MIAIFVLAGGGALSVGVLLTASDARAKRENRQLLATGWRVQGTIVSVGTGRRGGRSGATPYYFRPIVLALAMPHGEERVEVEITVPEMLQSLVLAGAPCDAVVDPANRTRICLVAITNAFGVKTPVQLGSIYSSW